MSRQGNNIRRATVAAQRSVQRWLSATNLHDKDNAYESWQRAESNRRRAIDSTVRFNARYAVRPVAA